MRTADRRAVTDAAPEQQQRRASGKASDQSRHSEPSGEGHWWSWRQWWWWDGEDSRAMRRPGEGGARRDTRPLAARARAMRPAPHPSFRHTSPVLPALPAASQPTISDLHFRRVP